MCVKRNKIAAVTVATAIILSSTNLVSVTYAEANDEIRYANGVYEGEAYGFYQKGETRSSKRLTKTEKEWGLKQPSKRVIDDGLKMRVTFKDNKITNIELINKPFTEKDTYPDDPNYGAVTNKQKEGSWARTPGAIMKWIADADDYEKELKVYIDKLEKMKDYEDKEVFNDDEEATLIRNEILKPDAISKATWTVSGMTNATLNAVRKAREAAGEKVVISKIDLVNPSSSQVKTYSGDNYDLTKTSYKVIYSDGKSEVVNYSELNSKGLKLSVVNEDDKEEKDIMPSDGILKLNPNQSVKVIISSINDESKSNFFNIVAQQRTHLVQKLKYRIAGYKYFREAEVVLNDDMKNYTAKIDIPNDNDRKKAIEFFVEDFTNPGRTEAFHDSYMAINSRKDKQCTQVVMDGRENDAKEDNILVNPVYFQSWGKLDYRVKPSLTLEKDEINIESDAENVKLKEDIKILKDKILVASAKLGNSKEETKLRSVTDLKLKNSNFDVNGKSTFQLRAIKYNLIKFAQKVKADVPDVKKPEDVSKASVGEKNTDTELQPGQQKPEPGKHDIVNKDDLKSEIGKAEIIKKDDKYLNDTKEDKDKLDKALEKAKNVYSDKNAKQTYVDSAIAELIQAMDKLDGKKKTKPSPDRGISSSSRSVSNVSGILDNINTNASTKRIAGQDRIQTSIAISKRYFNKADTVILAGSEKDSDSLSASVLAKLMKAPIILTHVNSFDTMIKSEIQRLGVKKVIIIGGEKSISSNVIDTIKDSGLDLNIERIAGKDRYETSAIIAKRVTDLTGNKGKAVIASGEKSVDSLAVAPFASREGYPILLVKQYSIPDSIKSSIDKLGIKEVFVSGGKSSVSDEAIKGITKVNERFAGKNRYETYIAISKSKFKDAKRAFVTDANILADAIAISPVAGALDMPIVLTNGKYGNTVVENYVKNESEFKYVIPVGENSTLLQTSIDRLGKYKLTSQ